MGRSGKMNGEVTWSGKHARIIKTGELVEVISYDDLSLQVKTPGGYTASISRDEVSPATTIQEADVLEEIKLLKDKLERTEA